MEIFGVPSCEFSSELDAFPIAVCADQIEGEVADDSHVLSAMALADARQIVLEADVEHPVERVFNAPMAPDRFAKGFGRHRLGGDVKALFGPDAVLGLDPAFDHGDGFKLGKAALAGKAARTLHPIDGLADRAAALLDAAMAFIEISVAVNGGFKRIAEEPFDFGQKAWLVGLHGEEIIGSMVHNALGNIRIAGDGVDGDECASERARGGKAFEQRRNCGYLIGFRLHGLIS